MRLRRRLPVSPPGGSLFQRDHKRIASLVLLLGLMMIVFSFVGQPESARWFMQLTSPQSQEFVDSRLGKSLGSGGQAVVVAQADAIADPSDPVASGETPRVRFPGVTDELLGPIRDDGLFSSSEAEPYYQLLHLLAETTEAELQRYASADIPFSQLYHQPQSYRGQVLRLRGILRAAYADLRLGPNRHGLEKYHTLWISPIDRAKREIYFVRCLELPADLPLGEAPKDQPFGEVEFTGIYFKRLAYQARDDVRTTPLLLAKSVSWKKIEPVVADARVIAQEDHTLAWLAAAGFGLLVALGVLWFVTRKPTPDPQTARLIALAGARRRGTAGALETLRDLEVAPDVLAAMQPPTENTDSGPTLSSPQR